MALHFVLILLSKTTVTTFILKTKNLLLKDVKIKKKQHWKESLSLSILQFIPFCGALCPSLCCFPLPTPNSERQVIIYTPAKCLVKSPGKTELTRVELNLKILDGILLQSLPPCQVAFPALPRSQDPCFGPERCCFAQPLLFPSSPPRNASFWGLAT